MSEPERVLITAALLYANGTLHFGHLAGAYLSADIYARFERLQGKEVLFLSGSDEYGLTVTLSAERAGRTPQEQVDHYYEENRALFKQLGISFDLYARTTWEGHPETVHTYFEDLKANGFVEERETRQLYCEQEGRFLADRYVVGTCPHCGYDEARGDECQSCGHSYESTDLLYPRSKMSGAPLELRNTRHWFLLLDKLKPSLDSWLQERRWKPTVMNFVKHYLDELKPRAITRDASWGVPVPGAEGKVFYVWFDAPIGYISAARQWAQELGDPDRWRKFWSDSKTRLVHFIGKDNIFFHALFFPAMTLGQNGDYILVEDLPANEFLNLEGRQFSKSDGWFIDLAEFLKTYSVDQVRWTLAANAPETSDSEFTFHDFQVRCNSELLGKFGNFANRTLVFAQKRCGGEVPPLESLQEEDRAFLEEIRSLAGQIAEAYREFKVRQATQLIMEMATRGNVYFDHKKPWERKEELGTTIACCIRCLQLLALVASPIIPDAAARLWRMLGQEGEMESWSRVLSETISAGTPLPSPEILFSRIEDEQMEAEKVALKLRSTAP